MSRAATPFLAVPLIVAATAFALIFLPWEDKRDFRYLWYLFRVPSGILVPDPYGPMLVGSTFGGLAGGAVLARHFGLPGIAGAIRSVFSMMAALMIAGAIGGAAMGASVPGPGEDGLAMPFMVAGILFAIAFAVGLPAGFDIAPLIGLPITLAGTALAHLACRRSAFARPRPAFWPLLLVPAVPAVTIALALVMPI